MAHNDYETRRKLQAARRTPEEQLDVSTLQTAELLEKLDEAKETIEAFEKDFPGVAPFIRHGSGLSPQANRHDLAAIKTQIAERTDKILAHYEDIESRAQQPETQAEATAAAPFSLPIDDPDYAITPETDGAELSEEEVTQAIGDLHSLFAVENAVDSIRQHREEVTRLPIMLEEVAKVQQTLENFVQENPDAPVGKAAHFQNPKAGKDEIDAAFARTTAFWQAQHAALFSNETPHYAEGANRNDDLRIIHNVQTFIATYQAEDKSSALDVTPEEAPAEPQEPTLADKASAARDIIKARIAERNAQKGMSHSEKIESEREEKAGKEAGHAL